MIKRFNDEKPVIDMAYDVFNGNGDYLGYCEYTGDEWLDDMNECRCRTFKTEGTYYSDDHDDWLRMIEGLIEVQNKN